MGNTVEQVKSTNSVKHSNQKTAIQTAPQPWVPHDPDYTTSEPTAFATVKGHDRTWGEEGSEVEGANSDPGQSKSGGSPLFVDTAHHGWRDGDPPKTPSSLRVGSIWTKAQRRSQTGPKKRGIRVRGLGGGP